MGSWASSGGHQLFCRMAVGTRKEGVGVAWTPGNHSSLWPQGVGAGWGRVRVCDWSLGGVWGPSRGRGAERRGGASLRGEPGLAGRGWGCEWAAGSKVRELVAGGRAGSFGEGHGVRWRRPAGAPEDCKGQGVCRAPGGPALAPQGLTRRRFRLMAEASEMSRGQAGAGARQTWWC